MSTLARSRWAAIGAAVAVTLGAGGLGIANATTDSADGPVSAFFPIEPCRLASNEVILADSSTTLDGWGTTGNCELPSDITGLAANVTAVNATDQTNLRFYAEGGDVPDTANLNPSPGAAPTPNAVNITLNDTNGKFNVYNRFGTVGVFIDVMGYYDDHTHDDRYYTKAEVDTATTFLDDKIANSGGVAFTSDDVGTTLNPTSPVQLLTMPVTVAEDGFLVVDAMVNMVAPGGISVICWIGLDTTTDTTGHGVFFQGAGTGVYEWNDTLGFPVTAGAHAVNLLCQQENGAADDVTVQLRRLSGVFSTTLMS